MVRPSLLRGLPAPDQVAALAEAMGGCPWRSSSPSRWSDCFQRGCVFAGAARGIRGKRYLVFLAGALVGAIRSQRECVLAVM